MNATQIESLRDEYDYLTSNMIREVIDSENAGLPALTATQVNDNIKLRVALRAKNEHVKASEDIRGYPTACLLDDKFCSIMRGLRTNTVKFPLPPRTYPSRARTCAVLIGCDYNASTEPLIGAYRDVARMYSLLCDVYHWRPDGILVMTDVEFDDAKYHYHMIPTKANILDAVSKLGKQCIKGDILVFYYSGRGEEILDLNGEGEEAIVACDDGINGKRNIIKAHELRLALRDNLVVGADLMCVFESSCVAQILGLANFKSYRGSSYKDDVDCGRNIICLSASDDGTPPKRLTSPHGVSYGAFTKTLVENCRQSPRITAVTLLSRLNSTFLKHRCENRAVLTWSDTLSESTLFDLFLSSRPTDYVVESYVSD